MGDRYNQGKSQGLSVFGADPKHKKQDRERERDMNKLMLVATTAVFALAGANASFAADKKTLAFVVNGASDFWQAAEAGVKKAAGELPDDNLVFKYPQQAAAASPVSLIDDRVA